MKITKVKLNQHDSVGFEELKQTDDGCGWTVEYVCYGLTYSLLLNESEAMWVVEKNNYMNKFFKAFNEALGILLIDIIRKENNHEEE